MEFEYKAVDESGQQVCGVIQGPDRRSAIGMLAEQGCFVTVLEQKGASRVAERVGDGEFSAVTTGKLRVSSKDILSMTSQLATALRAGLGLLNCLEIIGAQQKIGPRRQLIDELARAVRGGDSFSDALAKHEQIFSPLYISMIRVGETGGILEQTTTQLTELLKREEKIKTNLKSASMYPAFVLGVGLVSVVIVITWILPRILSTISGGMAVLPLPTRMLLELSGFIKSYGLIAAACGAGIGMYFRSWKKTESGRLAWDEFKLKIPVLGAVLRSIAVGRFARTLGELTKGGITILNALAVVRDTLGNELLGRDIDYVIEKVRTGSPLAEGLAKGGHFPQLLIQIVSVGEQTGKLDEMLLNAAETFDEEADAAINRFVAIFPAILIVVLALVIGFIVAATLLPIVTMELGVSGG